MSQQTLTGKVHQFGNDIDTDVIIPARYLNTSEASELAKHCMEDIDTEFVKNVKAGDIMVGGDNFGCGSSREHAPIAIKASGISCVVANTFSRIFYRNAINIGLPVCVCPEAVAVTENGDTLSVDLISGIITNVTKGKSFQSAKYPATISAIIASGGLVNYVRAKLGVEAMQNA